jgi:hypothetical protein
MDESFYEFWGLQNPEDNFCYAVFGLPDQHLRTLDQFHAEFLRDFQTAVKTDLNREAPRELKSHLGSDRHTRCFIAEEVYQSPRERGNR